MRYSIHIFYDPSDDDWIATSPEFPHVSAFGDSRHRALNEMIKALELAVETYKKEGWSLPAPLEAP